MLTYSAWGAKRWNISENLPELLETLQEFFGNFWKERETVPVNFPYLMPFKKITTDKDT